MRGRKWQMIPAIFLILVLLAACGQNDVTPTASVPSGTTVPPTAEIPPETEADPTAFTAADPAETTGEVLPVTEPEATQPPATEVPTTAVPPETSEVPSETEPPTSQVPPETTEVPPETKPADQIIRYDDGSKIVRRFDEEGRQIEESFYYANGQLNYTDQKEFYPDGSVKREYYEEHFRDGSGKNWEYVYHENGETQFYRGKAANGTSFTIEYDEQGRKLEEQDYYAGGQKSLEIRNRYYPDSEQLSETHRKEWKEDGSLRSSNDETFWQDGTQKTMDRTYTDGTRWVKECREDGQVLLEESYHENGQLSSKEVCTYDENGVVTEKTYAEWLSDGSLNRCWEDTYWPDGSTKTERSILSWTRDQENYYEYDEQGRTVLNEVRALDGSFTDRSVMEYYPDSEQVMKQVDTSENSDGIQRNTYLYREDGSFSEITKVYRDGTSRHELYAEEGYCAKQENYDANGFLLRVEETEYYENSQVPRRTYWKSWEEDLNDYSWSETINDENWVMRKHSGTNYNGSSFVCEYDESGNETLADYWYANGQQESHYEYRYDENGQRIFEGERYWDEDGSHERYYEDTYWPNGQRKTTHREDGDKIYEESYNEQGKTVLRQEYTKTVQIGSVEYVYAADGTSCTEYHRKSFAEDGTLFAWTDEYYYTDGSLQKKHYGSVEGWEETYEYRKDGTLKLEINVNMEGVKVYEYVLYDDDGYVIREWHDNGLLRIYRKHDTAAGTDVYEQYLDDSTPYIRNVDGPGEFRDYRTYDTNIGMVRFQTLIKDGIYHDRYYEEGRMTVDRRYTALPDGGYDTYLGNTVWEYFTEGGVKKIRISENDENGTMISQKVIDDDGKTGYPDV